MNKCVLKYMVFEILRAIVTFVSILVFIMIFMGAAYGISWLIQNSLLFAVFLLVVCAGLVVYCIFRAVKELYCEAEAYCVKKG